MKRITLLFTIALTFALFLFAHAESTAADALRERLAASAGVDAARVTQFFCDDYDGDGTQEAFALIDRGSDETAIIGDVWFVSETRVEALQTGASYLWLEQCGDTAPILFSAEEWYGGSASVSRVWRVDGGAPVQVDISGLNSFRHGEGNEYYATLDAFDGSSDGTGHTWKRYYFYYENGQIYEYGGIYISMEELLEFDGAQAIIDAARNEGREIDDIIYRGNGIININTHKGQANGNMTLRYDAVGVTRLEEDYGGVYMLASGLREAVYPQQFVHPGTAEVLTQGDGGTDAPPAAQSAPESDFAYEPCEGGCAITGYSGGESVVRIPETLGGMTVVAIGENAFSGQETIREVYLPAGVKTIGRSAFNRCTAMEHIGLNDGLARIDEWAFNKCKALTSVDIPASVASIGDIAFSGCSALETLVVNSPNTSFDENEIIKGSAQAAIVRAWVTPTPDMTPIPTIAPTPVPDVDGADVYAGHYTLGRSSVRKGNDFDVRAEKAVDGNLGTAWNAHDRGKGEWISFMMPSGKSCRMAGFRIVNGYIKNNKAYTENTRIRTLDLYCDGVYVQSFTLSDDRAMQTFWLSQPVTGREFRMEAGDVYSGSMYRDLSVTEVELLGANNEDFHTRDLSGWGRAVDMMAQKLYDGGTLQRGSYGYDVMGLQVLLDRGFGLLKDVADGSFGGNTESALNALMEQMRASGVASSLEPMRDGVADAAFMRNLQRYIQSR